MGGLKNAYALLAYYLNPNNKNLSSVVVDKIVTLKDEKYFQNKVGVMNSLMKSFKYDWKSDCMGYSKKKY